MEDESKWLEKRSHPRVPRRFVMRAKPKGDMSRKWELPTIRDISLAGSYFYSGFHFEVGQELDIEVTLPVLKDPMRIMGVVRRVEAGPDIWGIAVEFVQMNEDEKAKFQEVIDFTLKNKKSDGDH